jgi:uncharacterized protein (TIGR00266 family)
MEFVVKHDPVFSILEIEMNEGEVVLAQPNSMLAMTSGLSLSATVGHSHEKKSSGVMSGARSVLGGENMFTAEFRASRDKQLLTLAPSTQGDILILDLKATSGMFLTRGSYLASIEDCKLAVRYGGMKGLMSKKGLFLLHASGSGTVFCQTYGAIVRRELAEGERYLLDNRYAVAFSDTIEYQLVKATKSVRESIMSGEGLINRYTGPGVLYYQTRAKPPVNFLSYLLGSAF